MLMWVWSAAGLMKKQAMKKFTLSLCCIALPVLFSSCQKEQAAADTATPPTEQKVPSPADTSTPPTEQKGSVPADVAELLRKASLEYKNGDYVNCQATLQQLVTNYGARAPMLHGPKLGMLYYRKGLCELKLANDAKLDNNPEDANKWFAEAAKSFETCYKQFPNKVEGKAKTTHLQHKAALQLGDGIADKLMQSLGSKLKGALQAGGPAHALEVCKQLAEPSTEMVSSEFEGIKISRVSLKPRNQANAPDELDKELLTKWQKQIDAGAAVPKSELHYRDDSTAVFYRPIMTQDVCMNCHGEPAAFPEQLTARLNELYPDDQATGYKTGQLRGAFRVAFSAAE